MLKLDLGCGHGCREGYTGVDYIDIDGAIKCNLEKEILPFGDNSVSEIYSSHCFEHLDSMRHVFSQMVRVCKNGAKIEIWTPHFSNPMAMCYGHKVVWSETQWMQMCGEFKHVWFDLKKGYIQYDSFEYDNEMCEISTSKKVFKYYHQFAMIGHVEK